MTSRAISEALKSMLRSVKSERGWSAPSSELYTVGPAATWRSASPSPDRNRDIRVWRSNHRRSPVQCRRRVSSRTSSESLIRHTEASPPKRSRGRIIDPRSIASPSAQASAVLIRTAGLRPPAQTQIPITNIGVAAHICAASPGGARYVAEMTPDQLPTSRMECGCAKPTRNLLR
jgi:hypothetical protein